MRGGLAGAGVFGVRAGGTGAFVAFGTAILVLGADLRPLVVSSSSQVWLHLARANEGTTLVVDGQIRLPMQEGDQVHVRRHEHVLCLLQNPDLNYWKLLAKKMHWAARPRSR